MDASTTAFTTPLALLVGSFLVLPSLIGWGWQARRRLERHVLLLRQQLAQQRAASVQFVEHARGQIDILQSELAQSRRREDLLRARQAGALPAHPAPAHDDTPHRTVLMVRRSAIGRPDPANDESSADHPRWMCRQDAQITHAPCTQPFDHPARARSAAHRQDAA